MAKTKKKRRRKHRGTQAGAIDDRRRGSRPKTRAEARNQAKARKKSSPPRDRRDSPPTWKGATYRGLFASIVFLVLLTLFFDRTFLQALPVAAFMLVFYIPAGYYMDRFLWRRRERAKIRSNQKG